MHAAHNKRVEKTKENLKPTIAASRRGLLMTLMPSWLIQSQLSAIVWMQHATGRLAVPLSLLSFVASGKAVVVIVVAMLWFGGEDNLGWVPSRNSAAVLCFCGVFKGLLKGPRPYWLDDKIKALDPTLEASFGFPSGHTSAAIALFGMLALHTQSLWICVSTFVLVCLIAFSRILTGAHFIHDVVGGGIIGALGLIVGVGAFGVPRWHENKGQLSEAAITGLLALMTILVVVGFNMQGGVVTLKDVKEPVAGAGFLFGISLCHILHFALPPPSQQCSLPPVYGFLTAAGVMVILELCAKRFAPTTNGGMQHTLAGLIVVVVSFSMMQVVNFWGVLVAFPGTVRLAERSVV